MAYSLFLKGPAFNHSGWLQDLNSIYIENPENAPTPLSGLCHQISELDEDLERDELWLHPVGGIRGVTIRQENGEVELSLPTGCSPTDFNLAWDLMRLGTKHGAAASDDENDSLHLSPDEIETITATQSKFSWAVILQNLDSELTLPVGGFLGLKVTREDAADGAAGLEERLVRRMKTYGEAFVATLMQMTRDGQKSLFSNYGHIPSLIRADVEYIGSHGEHGSICDDPIPAAHFFSTLGGRVENLGDWNYVPTIDFSTETDLADALRSFSTAPAVPKPTAVQEQGLTGEDWAMLAKAPCLIFLIVAAADGSIDKKEAIAFAKILNRHGAVASPVFSRILQIAQANVDTFLNEMVASGVSPATELISLSALLLSGKIPQDEAVEIAKHLTELGKAIASASGGWFGMGAKISEDEAKALKLIEMMLMGSAKQAGA